MTKPFSLLLLFILCFFNRSLTQNLVRDYKEIADSFVLKHFDASLLSRIKCDEFSTASIDSLTVTGYFYNKHKNERILFSSIIFDYYLYHKTLKSNIRFSVSVNKEGKITNDSATFTDVPDCVRQAQNCGFISADSAKTLATTDSIEYVDDLHVYLRKNRSDQKYYWVVMGYRPSERHKTTKQIRGYAYAYAMSSDQERIINAQTGLIISFSQFQHD